MTTINSKEKEFLGQLMAHPLFENLITEGEIAQVESLRVKLNKKKIDKKAAFGSLTIADINGQCLTFKMDKGNGSLLMTADRETFKARESFAFKWDTKILADLITYFHAVGDFWSEPLLFPYHKGYGDEFNVYEDEVERSINLSRSGISFECFTGDLEDDNWTRIRPSRIKKFLKMMNAYLFLAEDGEKHLQDMPEEIQAFYPLWKQRLADGDLEIG